MSGGGGVGGGGEISGVVGGKRNRGGWGGDVDYSEAGGKHGGGATIFKWFSGDFGGAEGVGGSVGGFAWAARSPDFAFACGAEGCTRWFWRVGKVGGGSATSVANEKGVGRGAGGVSKKFNGYGWGDSGDSGSSGEGAGGGKSGGGGG